MGGGMLPEGIELALNSMPVGEKASFVLPAKLMQLAGSSKLWQDVPPGAEQHELLHVTMELDAMEEVRDMTGDGKVSMDFCNTHSNRVVLVHVTCTCLVMLDASRLSANCLALFYLSN